MTRYRTLSDLPERYRRQAEEPHKPRRAERIAQSLGEPERGLKTDFTASYILPIELTNGNEGRTKHYGASAKRRREYERIIRAKCGQRTPPDYPVTVTVTRILGKGQRLWDYSSGLRGNYKELEDAMTACGWWHDDGPEWVKGVIFRQDATRRELGPAVLVEVEAICASGEAK